MQPERVEKIKSLLALALSKPPHEREAFLDRACGGDGDLKRDVESYLGRGDKTDQFHFYDAKTVPNAHISLENPSPQATVQITADQRIGKQFGKYIIRSRVAEGGMGIVYLALDTQLGREVALKVLPEYFSMDRDRVARFHREARATSLLNHPNIVTVFEIGQIDGCQYIVTEFVEGRTLRDLMRQGQVPFVEILKIASQVAGALAAAHRAGIIHRDIKPENVMIRPDGYVKVLDFGLAKLTDATREAMASGADTVPPSGVNRTVPGMIMGTVSYMSPEQAEGLETDGRTDIWSLGVIVYEMASGKVPFSGPTASHTIVAILERDPEELHDAPPELKQIVTTALQKDRAMRFQTAEAMSVALEEFKHRLGYVSDKNFAGPAPTAESIAAVPPPPTVEEIAGIPPVPVRGRYRKLLWLVPAAFVFFLVAGVGIFAVANWLIDTPKPDPPANVARPSPSIEQQPVVIPTTPSPTPPAVYVDPTPEPQPERTTVPIQRPDPPATPRPRPEPVRTPVPEPRRTPTKRPRPTQDPNCVFTNSCN